MPSRIIKDQVSQSWKAGKKCAWRIWIKGVASSNSLTKLVSQNMGVQVIRKDLTYINTSDIIFFKKWIVYLHLYTKMNFKTIKWNFLGGRVGVVDFSVPWNKMERVFIFLIEKEMITYLCSSCTKTACHVNIVPTYKYLFMLSINWCGAF